ncbi:unnamed protein product [Ectocarpus sp. 13 AM-2016]
MDLTTKSRGCESQETQFQVSKPEPGNKRTGEGRREGKRGGTGEEKEGVRRTGPLVASSLSKTRQRGYVGFSMKSREREGGCGHKVQSSQSREACKRVFPRSDRERRNPRPPPLLLPAQRSIKAER